jgi:methylamine utilization protein MauE
MVRAYLKGMEISCGCFGPGETLSWKTLLRDGSMLAGSLLLTAVSFRNRTARNVQYEFQRVEGQ